MSLDLGPASAARLFHFVIKSVSPPLSLVVIPANARQLGRSGTHPPRRRWQHRRATGASWAPD